MTPDYINRPYFGDLTVTVNGQVTSVTRPVVMTETLQSRHPNVQGDRKHANPHWFVRQNLHLGQGYTSETTWNNGRWDTTISNGPVFGFTGTYSENTMGLSAHGGALVDRAMSQFWDEAVPRLNLVVDLAEAGQTIRMLRDTLRLRRYIGTFLFANAAEIRRVTRAMRVPTRREVLDTLSRKWLEGRYGWMPIIYSMYDALKLLMKEAKEGRAIKRRANLDFSVAIPRTGLGTKSAPWEWGIEQASLRAQVKGLINLKPGLRLDNWTSLSPLSIAWELLPFSFIADWVFTVGQQLELLENNYLYGAQLEDFHRTLTSRNVVTKYHSYSERFVPQTWSNGDIIQGQMLARSGWSTSKYERKTLDRLPGLPLPSGASIQVHLNNKRLTDALALISLLFSPTRSRSTF